MYYHRRRGTHGDENLVIYRSMVGWADGEVLSLFTFTNDGNNQVSYFMGRI